MCSFENMRKDISFAEFSWFLHDDFNFFRKGMSFTGKSFKKNFFQPNQVDKEIYVNVNISREGRTDLILNTFSRTSIAGGTLD